MLRFVLGPDNQIVPDIKADLPGRGVWITARRTLVERAVKQNLFAAAFKTKISPAPQLAELTGQLLEARALQSLALARKAGRLVTGFTKLDAMVRNGLAAIVLHASDASNDGRKKIASAIRFASHMGGEQIAVFSLWPSEILSTRLGVENVHHIGIEHGGTAKSVLADIKKLLTYHEEETANPAS